MKRILALIGLFVSAVAAAGIAATERGAVVESESVRLEFRDGVLVGCRNRFTGEEYISPHSDLGELVRHLPSGLGTQHREAERERAFELFHYPWWEHPTDALWPNQHHPHAGSKFAFEKLSERSARLTYTGLSDGERAYPDEVYRLRLHLEDNGDITVTPEGVSPRPGVYGVNLTVAPLMPPITVEAPIFDGIRITPDMQPMLWSAMWANYWDYAFVALNGWKRGCVGIWCPDAELKYPKTLYHLVDEQGLSLAFHGMNVAPFEKLTEAQPVSWRIRAFPGPWSQAVAHFRTWRLANVRLAPRAEWTKQISFVNMGVNGAPQWVDLMDAYFEGRHLERTLTFAAVIREEGFDRNHTNNRPYAEFKEHMKYWNEKGPKLMAYLNPVIMWSPKPTNEREEAAVRLAAEAKTVMPFQEPGAGSVPHFDVQHLGHPGWQRWFLDWIKEYCQDYGAHGIYHDEGQKTPLDNRGPINGLTPTMGRAEYHYKAQAENPESIHGTEHQTSVNNVGVSTSIGGGILWGTAQSMRHQRIRHASAVSNALHHPNGVIRAFPHFSEFHSKGSPQFFHWGMEQQERRAELAGHSIQKQRLFKGEIVPYSAWVNELWIERTRATTFVWEGLRPYFPEDWEKGVRSYFRAADGGEFRYLDRPWGSAFVELAADGERLIYGRLHGVAYARVGPTGAVPGWPVYNEEGPSGLHPGRYYCYDPAAERPVTYFRTNNKFSPSFYEGYVETGFVSASCATLDLQPIPSLGNITRYDNVVLVSATEPHAIWVDGKPQKPRPRVERVEWVEGDDGKRERVVHHAEGEYQINVQLPARVCVLLRPPAALPELEQTLVARYVSGNGPERRPVFADAFVQEGVTRTPPRRVKTDLPDPIHFPDFRHSGVAQGRYDLAIPVALPEGAQQGEVVLTVHVGGRDRGIYDVRVNGVDQWVAVSQPDKKTFAMTLRVPLDQKSPQALVQLQTEESPILSASWEPAGE